MYIDSNPIKATKQAKVWHSDAVSQAHNQATPYIH